MAVVAQCPSCRTLLAVDRVVVDGDRAGLRCTSCLAVAWLPVERAQVTARPALSSLAVVAELPSAAIFDLPLPALPAPTPMAIVPAPPLAGVLNAAAFDDGVIERVTAKLGAPAEHAPRQHELANRFSKLLTQWHNETEHKLLLKAAAAADDLAFVGSRYRAVLDVVRDEPRARAAQQELITLAMATMGTNRRLTTTDEPQSNAAKIVAVVVLVFVGVLGFGLGVKKMMASIDKAAAIE